MISYPLDWSKLWTVVHNDPIAETVTIRGQAKDIHLKEGNFGGTDVFVCLSYKDIKLSKEDTQKVKWARRTGNIDVLKQIYARKILLHQDIKNK